MSPDFLGLLSLLWQGFQLIGQAATGLIKMVLGFFGVTVPDWTVELATIIVVLLAIFEFGKTMSKIILVVLLLVLASTLVNAFLG